MFQVFKVGWGRAASDGAVGPASGGAGLSGGLHLLAVLASGLLGLNCRELPVVEEVRHSQGFAGVQGDRLAGARRLELLAGDEPAVPPAPSLADPRKASGAWGSVRWRRRVRPVG